MNPADQAPPLIAHVVYRFDIGGLENGVVNLLNRLSPLTFRHAVIALTEVTEYRQRVVRTDVPYFSLHKPAGHGIKLAPRLYSLFRELRPAIVHTRNLAALEATLPAWLARVPVRIHGEHGWDVSDLHGSNRVNRLTRHAYRPFVTQYIAMSADIKRYLVERIGINPVTVAQIYNGVDTVRFSPPVSKPRIDGCPFPASSHWLVGTVGRLQPVKDQATLVRAFALACKRDGEAARQMRLVIVGDGPERDALSELLRQAGVSDRAWLPGAMNDVPGVLRGLDCFVLPSLSEGISNTILEAMATGLPVIATGTGGNPELITNGQTGCLVPVGDPEALAEALIVLWRDRNSTQRLGAEARREVERRFSIERMVNDYAELYRRLLERGCDNVGWPRAAGRSS